MALTDYEEPILDDIEEGSVLVVDRVPVYYHGPTYVESRRESRKVVKRIIKEEPTRLRVEIKGMPKRRFTIGPMHGGGLVMTSNWPKPLKYEIYGVE